jgi:hypothetical protein
VYLSRFFAPRVRVVEVNRPDVVAEVRAAFDAYERALVANELDALDATFWADERVVRFAFGDVQLGAERIAAARRERARQTGDRRLEQLVLTTFGADAATAFAVFRLVEDDTVVHQSQTWVRFGDGWRVVAAHVSQT